MEKNVDPIYVVRLIIVRQRPQTSPGARSTPSIENQPNSANVRPSFYLCLLAEAVPLRWLGTWRSRGRRRDVEPHHQSRYTPNHHIMGTKKERKRILFFHILQYLCMKQNLRTNIWGWKLSHWFGRIVFRLDVGVLYVDGLRPGAREPCDDWKECILVPMCLRLLDLQPFWALSCYLRKRLATGRNFISYIMVSETRITI